MGHGSRGKHRQHTPLHVPDEIKSLADQLVNKAVDEVYWIIIGSATLAAVGEENRGTIIAWLEASKDRLELYCRNPFEAIQQFKADQQLLLPMEAE